MNFLSREALRLEPENLNVGENIPKVCYGGRSIEGRDAVNVKPVWMHSALRSAY